MKEFNSIPERYSWIKAKIAELACACGRNPEEITLVAVSKTFAADHILSAYKSGCRDFGENKVQEALEKIEALPDEMRWHMIGTLQKNKVRKAIGKFSLIHGVDNLELAEKIAICSGEAGLCTRLLLQVNISGEETKHGLNANEWRDSFERVLKLKNISLEGLMTIAPLAHDSAIVRNCFRNLREFRDELQTIAGERALLRHLSMGMSNDYPIAIQEGATLLRIGSAIFGKRDSSSSSNGGD